MGRLSRPLNRKAVRTADDAFYAKHPELVVDGRRVPLSETDPRQADLRREWVSLYKQHEGDVEQDGDKWPPKKPCKSALPCDTAATSPPPYDCKKDPPRPCAMGSPSFYDCRYKDFDRRHGGPPPSPPEYYLNYGKKYAEKFTALNQEDLSPKGLEWRDRTLLLLQSAIEEKLAENPCAFADLEMDDEAFTRFAYGTHARAYIDGGLFALPLQDLQKILRTPELKDLFKKDGLQQILDVLKEMELEDVGRILIETWLKDLKDSWQLHL